MIELCDLDEVKDRLRITSDRQDSDIQSMILQASAIILNYLKVDVDASPLSVPWGSFDVPWDVHATAMLTVGELHKEREGGTANIYSNTFVELLRRWRDPTMAWDPDL